MTAAEVVDESHFGYHVLIYAPEVTGLFPAGLAHHKYVVVFDGVAYSTIPTSGDPNGLNLSIGLNSFNESFAASFASALTTDLGILTQSSG